MKEKWYLVVMTGKIDKGAKYFTRQPNNRDMKLISGPHDWNYVDDNVDWMF